MNTKSKKQAKVLTKSERKKRGVIYLVVAAFILVIVASGAWEQVTNLAASANSIVLTVIFALLQLFIAACFFIGLIGGVYYLITGFTKKE